MPAGRPTSYNKQRADRYVAVIEMGGTHKAAAAAAGVNQTTSERWRTERPAFSERVDDAAELREVAWLNCIRKAVNKGDAKIAVAMLKMTNPAVYGNQRIRIDGPVELAGKLDVNGNVDLSEAFDNMTTEAIRKAIDRLTRDSE
jgi:hypothetical protein